MFKPILALASPSNSLQPLWRYFGYERLLQTLESKTLWFSHLPSLPDGLEGTLTTRTHERLVRHFVGLGHPLETALAEVNDYERHREEFFVNCWHMNRNESYLMWRVYGERGFAIQTTFERLQLALDAHDGEINGTVVQYRDFQREALAVGNIYTAVSTKDAPYQDEREFRLLVWQPDAFDRRDLIRPPGIAVSVNLEALIERIYVSPRFAASLDPLRAALDRRGLECDVVVSAVKEQATRG